MGVKAKVVDINTGNEELTNDFRFTWCRDNGAPLQRCIVPMTYKGMLRSHYESYSVFDYFYFLLEAMWWIEGKRALELGAEIRDMREIDL